MPLFELLDRWLHFGAGVVWLGLLFFLHGVHAVHAARAGEPTHPALTLRALWWFRWSAAFTWMSGFLLLFLVYYHGYDGANLFDGQHPPATGADWGPGLVGVLAGFVVYDQLFLRLPRALHVVGVVVGVALAVGFALLLRDVQGFSARATLVHVGALFGTVMALNVWLRIGPAQERIAAALRAGDAPREDDARLAEERARHNAYLAAPVLLFMIGVHQDALLSLDTTSALGLAFGVCFVAVWGVLLLARRLPVE